MAPVNIALTNKANNLSFIWCSTSEFISALAVPHGHIRAQGDLARKHQH